MSKAGGQGRKFDHAFITKRYKHRVLLPSMVCIFQLCVMLHSLVLKLLYPPWWLLQRATSHLALLSSTCILGNEKSLKMKCWDLFLGNWWELRGDEKATARCWAVLTRNYTECCSTDYSKFIDTEHVRSSAVPLQNTKSFGWTVINVFRRTDRLRLFAL